MLSFRADLVLRRKMQGVDGFFSLGAGLPETRQLHAVVAYCLFVNFGEFRADVDN